jgi:hypothetical protein
LFYKFLLTVYIQSKKLGLKIKKEENFFLKVFFFFYVRPSPYVYSLLPFFPGGNGMLSSPLGGVSTTPAVCKARGGKKAQLPFGLQSKERRLLSPFSQRERVCKRRGGESKKVYK